MSETGSYKSASSVSESDSSSAPPPSSSSSEEVHTCHRCGNACYSDKSWIKWSLTSNAAYEDMGGCTDVTTVYPAGYTWWATSVGATDLPLHRMAENNAWGSALAVALQDADRTDPEIQTLVANAASHGIPPDLDDTYAEYKGLWYVVARRNCETNKWEWFALYEVWGKTNEGVWEDYLFRSYSLDTIDNCVAVTSSHSPCGAEGAGVEFDLSSVELDAEWSIEVKNNPCCRDPLVGGDQCAQHFNGDCRGNCDEEPSSESSASSSEENPLP